MKKLVGFAAACLLCVVSDSGRLASLSSDASAQLAAFIDDFITEGRNESAVADLSEAYYANQLTRAKAALVRLRGIDRSALPTDDAIDARFAESILVGRELVLERMQPWKKDPRSYLQFRGLSTAIGRSGEPETRAAAVLRTLRAIPAQLSNGRKNLAVLVPRFQELSLFMAQGALTVLDKDVPAFAETVPSHKSELLAANASARTALAEFLEYLKTDLPKLPRGDFAIGKATYDEMLKGQYLLPYDSDSLYAYAQQQFNQTVRELEAVAKTIDLTKTWQQLAEDVKQDYPDPAREIKVHQEWVNKARDHILSKHLIPIPWKERVDVVPRAEYLRKTSYYGNFSGAASRPPLPDGTLVGQWQINPFEPQWDDKTKHDYLLEHDWGVIIVTAPHETYGGHHVQGLYQMHNPRKLRQTQSISIFSEGWGLYNEQLMQETGFFPSEKIHLRQLQLRLWRNARVIWDVGIHTGKMSYEDAVSLLSDKVGFLRWAAELEVDGSAENPGYRIGYCMGMSEILKMREEFKQRMGDRFSLSDFHERLLRVGSMPPALMREGLMASVGTSHDQGGRKAY
jgi:uncharacterized protein (DUF885 family)